MEKNEYDRTEIFQKQLKEIKESIKEGKIYENGNGIKYQVLSINKKFVMVSVLDPCGNQTKIIKTFLLNSFTGLIYNNHFDETKIAKRETFVDLRKYNINSQFKK